jgi:hypothetical protein
MSHNDKKFSEIQTRTTSQAGVEDEDEGRGRLGASSQTSLESSKTWELFTSD